MLLRDQPTQPRPRLSPTDADNDSMPNDVDSLPFTPGTVSWKLAPEQDGLPPKELLEGSVAINFTSQRGPAVVGFRKDHGSVFDPEQGYGWQRDLSQNTRLRNAVAEPVRDGFVFTRKQDAWECQLSEGRWRVLACLGDAGHDQPGQHLTVEGRQLLKHIDTAAGCFREVDLIVEVKDGRLTVVLGTPAGGSNTCINWLVAYPVQP